MRRTRTYAPVRLASAYAWRFRAKWKWYSHEADLAVEAEPDRPQLPGTAPILRSSARPVFSTSHRRSSDGSDYHRSCDCNGHLARAIPGTDQDQDRHTALQP